MTQPWQTNARGYLEPHMTRRFTAVMACISILLYLGNPAIAESVSVKGRGMVDLAPFKCQNHTQSGFITRVCYDARSRYMLIGFEDGTYRQYCRVDVGIADGLVSAPSKGKFYSTRIRPNTKTGPFDCGTH